MIFSTVLRGLRWQAKPHLAFKWKGSSGKIYIVRHPKVEQTMWGTAKNAWRGLGGLTGKDWIPKVHFYNKGMPLPALFHYSMSERVAENLYEEPDWQLYLDFEKTPTADKSDYPFLHNRSEISYEFGRHIKGMLDKHIAKINKDYENAEHNRFMKMIDDAPEFSGVKVFIPFRDESEFKRAKEIVAANKDFWQAWAEYFSYFKQAWKEVEPLYEAFTGKGIKTEIHLTVDDRAQGFRPNEWVVGKNEKFDFIALNPISLDKEMKAALKKAQTTFKMSDDELIRFQASMIANATIHEWAHVNVRDSRHGDSFTLEANRIANVVGPFRLAILTEKAYEISKRFGKRADSIGESLKDLGAGGNRFKSNIGDIFSDAVLQGQGMDSPSFAGPRGREDRLANGRAYGDATASLLGPIGQNPPPIVPPHLQPGPVVSWDFERNRTWVMKMHEFVDPAYRIVGVEVQKLQKVIQELSPRSHRKLPKYLHAFAYDKRLKRSMQSDAIDKALFLYVDSGGDAGAGIRSRFRQMAQMQISDPNGYIRIMRIPPGPMAARIKSNPHRLHLKETLRLLDMVDNFTQGHKDFANVMSNRFRDAGALANRHGLLKSFVDNYVRRQYLMRKGEEIEPSGTGHGFKTYFSPAFPRYYDYVLDAILDGFELRNKGITTAYQSYMEELVRVIGNKQFIRVGMATVGADGNKLFTTNKRQGYKPLKGFTVWTWACHVEATKEVYGQPALTIDDYGKRFFATPISEVPEMFYVYKTPTHEGF